MAHPQSTLALLCPVQNMSQQGSLRRISFLGALGEGSGWDLRIRPAPAPAVSGNLGTWKSGKLGIWRSGGLEIHQKNQNSQNSNPFCPKCRQGLDKQEQNPLGPIWGHLRPFFHGLEKNQKMQKKKCLFSLVGQWALFTRCGPLLLSTQGGETGKKSGELTKQTQKSYLKDEQPLAAKPKTPHETYKVCC